MFDINNTVGDDIYVKWKNDLLFACFPFKSLASRFVAIVTTVVFVVFDEKVSIFAVEQGRFVAKRVCLVIVAAR